MWCWCGCRVAFAGAGAGGIAWAELLFPPVIEMSMEVVVAGRGRERALRRGLRGGGMGMGSSA